MLDILKILVIFCVLFFGAHEAKASERHEENVMVDGIERSYIVYYPENISEKRQWPVMIAFHPAFGTGQRMESLSNLHLQDSAENYIIIYPDGVGRTWNAEDCCGKAQERNINDLKFFDVLLSKVQEKASIEKRVFVTGYSNGAKMVYHLMCHRSEKIAAAAPFGATKEINECRYSRPIPLLHIHGDSDKSSPHLGGYAQGFYWRKKLGYMHPVTTSTDKIAELNQCQTETVQSYNETIKTVCERYKNCANDTETAYCIIEGLGHAWPGAKAENNAILKRFGPNRPDIKGSQAIIDFFDGVRKTF